MDRLVGGCGAWRNNRMEWQRGVNYVKRVAGFHGVHVSRVCFKGRDTVLYGLLTTSVVNF